MAPDVAQRNFLSFFVSIEFGPIEQLVIDPSLLERELSYAQALGDLVRIRCKLPGEIVRTTPTVAELRWTKMGWELSAEGSQLFGSLSDLCARWAAEVQGPWLFRVDADCESPEDLQKYLHWMQTEHLAEVVATGLVQRAWIERPSEKMLSMVSMLYVFRRKIDYEKYLETHAPTLRDRGRERSPVAVTYRRSIAQILFFL